MMLMLQKNINQYCRGLSKRLLLRVYERAMMSKLNVGGCMPTNQLGSSLLGDLGCQMKCRNSFKKGSEDVGAPQEPEKLCLLLQTQSHLKY